MLWVMTLRMTSVFWLAHRVAATDAPSLRLLRAKTLSTWARWLYTRPYRPPRGFLRNRRTIRRRYFASGHFRLPRPFGAIAVDRMPSCSRQAAWLDSES